MEYTQMRCGLEDDLSVTALEESIELEEDKNEHKEVEEDRQSKFQLGHDRTKKDRSLDIQNTGEAANLTFKDMGLKEEIFEGLERGLYSVPSPIQVQSIPLGKFGYDLVIQSKSGTGKTCAFAVIVLEHLDLSPDVMENIQAIILAPTREIAVQNGKALRCIGSKMQGLKVKEFIGGTSIDQSIRRCKDCNVVSGTPGRILHMINENEMDVSGVRVIVLDEADRLMEFPFITDIMKFFDSLPEDKQVIAASATYSDGLKDFVKRFMSNPMDITTDASINLLYVPLYAADVNAILNIEKPPLDTEEVFKNKMKVVWDILTNMQYNQGIIFSTFVLRANEIYEKLKEWDLDVVLLTSSINQSTRLKSLRSAQEGKCKIMVASNLGARGIDCEGVDLVINFELPDAVETFIHRYGRAGRFGSSGTAITLVSYKREQRALFQILGGSNLNIRLITRKSQLENLGASDAEKLRKLPLKSEQVMQCELGNSDWNSTLQSMMVPPTKLPSYDIDLESCGDFAIEWTLDASIALKEMQDIKAAYGY